MSVATFGYGGFDEVPRGAWTDDATGGDADASQQPDRAEMSVWDDDADAPDTCRHDNDPIWLKKDAERYL